MSNVQRMEAPSRRKPAPDQAQLRIDPETGRSYIYVEKPEQVVIAEMDADAFAAFKARVSATQPTEDEVRTGIWNDERPTLPDRR